VPSHSKIAKQKTKEGGEGTYTPQKTDRISGVVAQVANDKGFGSLGPIDIAPGYTQLKSAIALYMPNSWSETYSAQYEEIQPGTLMNLMAEASQSGGQALSKMGNFGKNVAIKAVQGVVSNALGGVGKRAAGKITNPNAEQSFTGIDFREFNFDFLMSPKSGDEAKNVLNIIDTFRYHMHPEKSAAQYLIFPSEFEISFYSGDGENNFIGGLSTCALVGMDVNYTPNDVWSSFGNGPNNEEFIGCPTSIRLQLRFKELEPLTKDRIEAMKDSPYDDMHRLEEPTKPAVNDKPSHKAPPTFEDEYYTG
jgi:hypothetical protein